VIADDLYISFGHLILIREFAAINKVYRHDGIALTVRNQWLNVQLGNILHCFDVIYLERGTCWGPEWRLRSSQAR
jgi:hypothetical protein